MLVYQRVHQKIYPGSVGNFLCLFASDKLPGFDTFDKPIGQCGSNKPKKIGGNASKKIRMDSTIAMTNCQEIKIYPLDWAPLHWWTNLS